MTTVKPSRADKAPAKTERMRKTIPLSRPLSDGSNSWTELTVHEPELGDRIRAERKGAGMEAAVELLAILTGLPSSAARKMKTRDARAIHAWLDSLMPDGEPVADVDDAESRTFDLLVPLEVDGRPMTQITVREPDLEAGIAVEKLKGRHEQTAASIAVLSGLTIPVVRKMVMRDVARIEAWLLPFVDDTNSKEEAGET
ncbi:phage tail assembly protein [Leptospira interrogans]